MKDLTRQFIRHSIVGTFAFLVDFACMVFLVEVCGLKPLVASVISFAISVVVSYWGSMRFVFEHDPSRSRSQEFRIYMILSVIGLALNSLCMFLGEHLLISQGIDYHNSFHYMAVKVIATAIVTVYNFWSRRKWIDAHMS